jgi:hypothetical membrane protein
MAEGAPGPKENSSVLERFSKRTNDLFIRFGIYIGVFAGFYVWVVILCCALTSSWWVFTQSSFSAFGTSSAYGGSDTQPWIYNDAGMIPTGLMLMLFSLALTAYSKNKVQVMGSSFFFMAGAFLVLVGVYHGGTKPHDFVSEWFFIMAFISIITWGIGLLLGGGRRYGFAIVALAILSIMIAAVVNWPSVATAEAFGVAAIDVWLVLMFFALRKDAVRNDNIVTADH